MQACLQHFFDKPIKLSCKIAHQLFAVKYSFTAILFIVQHFAALLTPIICQHKDRHKGGLCVGGQYRVRTCDFYHVKVALSR